jgi:hypothetical protein
VILTSQHEPNGSRASVAFLPAVHMAFRMQVQSGFCGTLGTATQIKTMSLLTSLGVSEWYCLKDDYPEIHLHVRQLACLVTTCISKIQDLTCWIPSSHG